MSKEPSIEKYKDATGPVGIIILYMNTLKEDISGMPQNIFIHAVIQAPMPSIGNNDQSIVTINDEITELSEHDRTKKLYSIFPRQN